MGAELLKFYFFQPTIQQSRTRISLELFMKDPENLTSLLSQFFSYMFSLTLLKIYIKQTAKQI